MQPARAGGRPGKTPGTAGIHDDMKLVLFAIQALPPGRRNLKDPRFDAADRLVAADKKTYAQVELVAEDAIADADGIVTTSEGRQDLILRDLEFIETRLSRNPPEIERAGLLKLKTVLESEHDAATAALGGDEWQAVGPHNFWTHRPVTVAAAGDLEQSDALLVRAFKEAGFICFLTVGGKENRAWPIRGGTTAWEAAGTIHSDLQRGFIRAEIIGYADFVQAGGETQAKRGGKLRLETKTYVMQDHDLVNFRFNK